MLRGCWEKQAVIQSLPKQFFLQPFVLGYFCKVEVPTFIKKTGAIFRRTEKFSVEAGGRQTWNLSKNLQDRIFR